MLLWLLLCILLRDFSADVPEERGVLHTPYHMASHA